MIAALAVEEQGAIDLAGVLEAACRGERVAQLFEVKDGRVVMQPAARQHGRRRSPILQKLAVDERRSPMVAPPKGVLGRGAILRHQIAIDLARPQPDGGPSAPRAE